MVHNEPVQYARHIDVVQSVEVQTVEVKSFKLRSIARSEPHPAAPAGFCSHYFIRVRTTVCLRHQRSSCLQLLFDNDEVQRKLQNV